MNVSTHQMAYWKETAIHIRSHNSHAALTQKTNMCNSTAIIGCANGWLHKLETSKLQTNFKIAQPLLHIFEIVQEPRAQVSWSYTCL